MTEENTKENITTVQMSSGTRDKLRILANQNLRSMAAHLEFMINREFELYKFEQYKDSAKGFQAAEEGRQKIRESHGD